MHNPTASSVVAIGRVLYNAFSVNEFIGGVTQGRSFAELRTNPELNDFNPFGIVERIANPCSR